MNIAKKTVLITGANRGIGQALVDEAFRRGVKRVYAGTRGSLTIADERVTPLTLDVTSPEQIQRAVEEIDTLDVLINNAGIAIYDDLSGFDAIEQHLAVNLFGAFHLTRAALPLLRRSKGAIVNNLSLMALAPLAGRTLLLHFEGGRVQHDAITESAAGRRGCHGSRRSSGPC